MKFRLGYATAAENLGRDFWDPLQISIDDDHKSQIIFRSPTSEEVGKRPKLAKQIFIIAEGEYSVSREISDILSCLERRELPAGAVTVSETARFLGDDGLVKEGYLVPVKAMPEQYRNFQSGVYDNLYQMLQRAFRVVRWRYCLEGQHNPLQLALDIAYSRNGKDWKGAPFTLTGSITLGFPRPIGWPKGVPSPEEEIGGLLAKGADEPIGHALFREAWHQRSQNPRSALVMGIAAAEVGFKECITQLSPETLWLIENIQTPPIDKMLSRYWPELPNMPLVNKKKLKIPRTLIKTLNEAIK